MIKSKNVRISRKEKSKQKKEKCVHLQLPDLTHSKVITKKRKKKTKERKKEIERKDEKPKSERPYDYLHII